MKVMLAVFIAICVGTAEMELNKMVNFEDEIMGKNTRNETSDNCGGSIKWTFNSDNSTLTISGTGNMTCCINNTCPWSENASQVKNIVIQDGVLSIQDKAFKEYVNLESVSISSNSSLQYIGTEAFFWM